MSDVSTGVVAAQWALLLGLGTLVVVMYRQLAYLVEIGRTIAGSGGLEIGDRAPEFEYLAPGSADGEWEKRAFVIDGNPTLLMFTHPGCGSCEHAMQNLQRAVAKSETPLRTLVITDAELEALKASEALSSTPFEVAKVDSRVTTKLYRTYRTLYVYAIDPNGEIRVKGGGSTAKEIRKMVREVAHKIR